MSDEKKYTEREIVEIQRDAARRILYERRNWMYEDAGKEINRLFPLPKVTVPRMLNRSGSTYRIGTADSLEWRQNGIGDWKVAYAYGHHLEIYEEFKRLGFTEERDAE